MGVGGTSGYQIEVSMLRRGDSVPHFEVQNVEGESFKYSAIWQHKNLLLVAIPILDSKSTSAYIADVTARVRECGNVDIECVITQDRVPGISAPAVVIADRWGEIIFAVQTSDVADLPPAQELIEWLNHMRNRCPECEGETR
jgi:hypothetical protein